MEYFGEKKPGYKNEGKNWNQIGTYSIMADSVETPVSILQPI